MRPLRLTMTAFGPYKEKEIIDFEQLKEANLFVISGNTGAGKTTIFDAICFALYGSASGEDRGTSQMLRSHFANDDVHTSVEFIFALHQRTYRVLRQLGHIKTGNRTPTGERYEFFEVHETGERPVVDRQMVSEINDKIKQMIGLTQEQFKQIVMLPQGEFRKLLTSDTENKEQIFRKIFKTERFNALNDRLREKRDELTREYEQKVQSRNHYIQQIESTFPMREDSEIFEALQADEMNVYQIESGLTKEIQYYKEQLKEDEKSYKKAYDTHQKQQAIYVHAQSTNTLFEEREEKQKRANILVRKYPLIQEKEHTLKRADRAGRVIVYETHAKKFSLEENHQQKYVTKVKEKYNEALKQLEMDQITYIKEEEKQEERDQIQKTIDTYKMYVPDVKEMKENEHVLHHLHKQVEQAKKNLQMETESVENNEKQVEYMQLQVTDLEKKTQPLFEKMELLNQLREQVTPLQQYVHYEKELQKLDTRIQSEKEKFQQAQTFYEKVENTWIHSQASILATHLHDGEACPVCGSTDHPNKNVSKETQITREELATAKKRMDDTGAIYQTSMGTRKGIESRLEEHWTAIRKWLPIETHEVGTRYDELVEKGTKVKEEVKEISALNKQLEEQKERLKQMADTSRTLIQKRDTAKERYQKKRLEYQKIQTIYERQQEKIPKEIHDLTVLQNRLEKQREALQQLNKAWEQAQKQLQNRKDQVTELHAQHQSAEKELQEAIKRRKEADRAFEQALEKGDFTSKEAYEKAQRSEESQEQMKKEIDSYYQEKAVLSERLAVLEKELAEEQYRSLHDLKEELQTLKETYEKAWEVVHRSTQYIERGEILKENMLQAHKQVETLEKQHGIALDVYDVIRGQNGPKISFERYIQMDYLEQIIEAANERFHVLSNGQYTLLRSERQESHGRQSGLALDVHDAYTGQKRDVKSLSGGEKFNASLSLALGMSDVVQSFQGNVSVETMFIDEGFGTLDEESLQNAIDTLIDLQRSGRMIGVISHVEQLKELFPAVLEVTKTKEGFSKTSFTIK